MFDHVDRVLQELAHGSGQDLVGHPYLDAQRTLRQWRKAILVDFLRILRQEASLAMVPSPRPEAGQPPRVEPDSQELSMPQEAELEESLAIGNLITKAEARYRPELLEIRLHLARLLHRSRLPERSNPYGPFAVCEAFRRSLLPAHPLEPSIRLVIYKYFDRYLMDQLGDFCRGCVDLAVAEGHVPGGGFQHLLRRGVHATAPAPAVAASGSGVQRAATLSFQALQGLLDLQRPAASRPAPRQVGVPNSAAGRFCPSSTTGWPGSCLTNRSPSSTAPSARSWHDSRASLARLPHPRRAPRPSLHPTQSQPMPSFPGVPDAEP